ncbi:Phosphoribosylformylglycinamidine synthase 2 [Sedimentisphaera cyanobacteriorum]|uniref:Phosphoribosylformylglycinamidine synthase subunit PurL n=1 Tax=Sedimentisphaera cyanobacteriorum TaxID=1940790 RepID=A0A1Q2HP47_9BACT|nr:phosphoribosylformylglycinamidine synthase subunit PurL [Sedimentisphaera cyanobacteriorum]AQQ09228.1 Phosphoribosylformylglycinamidine synthase 2 [Sedimentisphaera cyanobacteriorum]
MSIWRFEISSKIGWPDVHGKAVLEEIRELGIEGVENVECTKVFLIEADFDEAFAGRVADELLTDTVCEDCFLGRRTEKETENRRIVEVHLKSGVTDSVAGSVTAALADMGARASSVRTAKKYAITGSLSDEDINVITRRVLANDCVEEVIFGSDSEPPSPHTDEYQLKKTEIELLSLSEEGLMKLSKEMDLFLDEKEMKEIQQYYQRIGRNPTDVELETIAQTWSEHCVHKTLKSSIDMDFDGKKIHFDNLIKETVFKATKDLSKKWCVSVFEDNAGVVEFDEDDAVCFKVETHNHPSALDPYGGASTGIGGVLRDPMGTGLGAKPVANTDVFCFGKPDTKLEDVPKGTLHPRRVMKGVVSGVRDYGNRMGIPTVNGAVYFDQRYMANPLVFCGTVGLIPRDKCFGEASPGDYVVVVGGKTGRDGIHGATFSSGQMTHEHEDIFSHAVQIGDAITEKKALDTILKARDAGIYDAITDCGAGGLSSAVGEMGEKTGVNVELERVPLKYKGLSYTEIWISEAQERMVLAVKPENLEKILEIFRSEDVEAIQIGRFTSDKKLTLNYRGTQVGELEMEFLHNGIPQYSRTARWQTPKLDEPEPKNKFDYNEDLKEILSSYNVASKEWIIRQYDHEVQGGSVIKPLVGVALDGPSDAAVIRPKQASDKGVAIACGMNPLYGDIDPYWMALSGIDEAVRNVVCVGGRPDRIALLDNYCWGNCRKPEILGGLVRASQACYDGAMGFEAPFISGKDSLNNEFKTEDGTEINIPPTLLISALTQVDDVRECITMDLKKPGNAVYLVGETFDELGGSHYYSINGKLGANVPKVDTAAALKTAKKMHTAISSGLVRSAHDCSEGGFAAAAAEMAFAGGLGIECDAGLVKCAEELSNEARLFSESNSRYVVEVQADKTADFERALDGCVFSRIGRVTDNERVVITGGDNELINASIGSLKKAWQSPLAF